MPPRHHLRGGSRTATRRSLVVPEKANQNHARRAVRSETAGQRTRHGDPVLVFGLLPLVPAPSAPGAATEPSSKGSRTTHRSCCCTRMCLHHPPVGTEAKSAGDERALAKARTGITHIASTPRRRSDRARCRRGGGGGPLARRARSRRDRTRGRGRSRGRGRVRNFRRGRRPAVPDDRPAQFVRELGDHVAHGVEARVLYLAQVAARAPATAQRPERAVLQKLFEAGAASASSESSPSFFPLPRQPPASSASSQSWCWVVNHLAGHGTSLPSFFV